jgi:protoporphyrin/coproporphyrin ferrochelatase
MAGYDAILLLSFGGPEGPEDVIPFLGNVLAGRDVPPERMEAVAAHYRRFGGVSPINGQNRALIAALEAELAAHGPDLPVYWGNRNWHPLLTDTVRRMTADGVGRALVFVTSAFGSYSGCRQYREDLAAARAAVGAGAPELDKLRLYWNHPGFIEPVADGLGSTLAGVGGDPLVLFSAHSIPAAMSDGAPYLGQLQAAADLVARRCGVTGWELVFQSRSGPPHQPWLGPDVCDRLRALPEPSRPVVVCPIGFVSDHMEVVYDLDTAAAGVASDLGIDFRRAPTVGTNPRFVRMIRELIGERLDATQPRLALGDLGPWPDACPVGCCPAPSPAARRPEAARPEAARPEAARPEAARPGDAPTAAGGIGKNPFP